MPESVLSKNVRRDNDKNDGSSCPHKTVILAVSDPEPRAMSRGFNLAGISRNVVRKELESLK